MRSGFYENLMQIAFGAACFVSAALAFAYLWKKGRLDMDQEPAERMLKEEDDGDDKGT